MLMMITHLERKILWSWNYFENREYDAAAWKINCSDDHHEEFIMTYDNCGSNDNHNDSAEGDQTY